MKSYNPEEGIQGMGMLCNQQNKKKEVKHQKKLLNLFVVLIIEKSFVLRCNKI